MSTNTFCTRDIATRIARLWNCTVPEDMSEISANLTVRPFRRYEHIYNEGERPTHVLFLVSGKAKVVKECSLGRSQIVRIIKEQSFMGYRAFFANEPYSTSAVSLEDSVVAAIPLDIMVELTEHNPEINKYFIVELAQTLGTTDGRFVALTQKHIRGRLAETILNLKDSYGLESDGATIDIIMSRDDLASLSNMSTSNVIRTLSAFAHEGIIGTEGKKIKILNTNELQHISNLG